MYYIFIIIIVRLIFIHLIHYVSSFVIIYSIYRCLLIWWYLSTVMNNSFLEIYGQTKKNKKKKKKQLERPLDWPFIINRASGCCQDHRTTTDVYCHMIYHIKYKHSRLCNCQPSHYKTKHNKQPCCVSYDIYCRQPAPNISRTLLGNTIYWSLRCSWSIACRRCSIYIFILDTWLLWIAQRQLQDETRNI